MPLNIDRTIIHCAFCKMNGNDFLLVRSMHGLYCSNEHCYTRETSGNLVPPAACEKCRENSFYFERDGTVETGMYKCISCGYEELT